MNFVFGKSKTPNLLDGFYAIQLLDIRMYVIMLL